MKQNALRNPREFQLTQAHLKKILAFAEIQYNFHCKKGDYSDKLGWLESWGLVPPHINDIKKLSNTLTDSSSVVSDEQLFQLLTLLLNWDSKSSNLHYTGLLDRVFVTLQGRIGISQSTLKKLKLTKENAYDTFRIAHTIDCLMRCPSTSFPEDVLTGNEQDQKRYNEAIGRFQNYFAVYAGKNRVEECDKLRNIIPNIIDDVVPIIEFLDEKSINEQIYFGKDYEIDYTKLERYSGQIKQFIELYRSDDALKTITQFNPRFLPCIIKHSECLEALLKWPADYKKAFFLDKKNRNILEGSGTRTYWDDSDELIIQMKERQKQEDIKDKAIENLFDYFKGNKEISNALSEQKNNYSHAETREQLSIFSKNIAQIKNPPSIEKIAIFFVIPFNATKISLLNNLISHNIFDTDILNKFAKFDTEMQEKVEKLLLKKSIQLHSDYNEIIVGIYQGQSLEKLEEKYTRTYNPQGWSKAHIEIPKEEDLKERYEMTNILFTFSDETQNRRIKKFSFGAYKSGWGADSSSFLTVCIKIDDIAGQRNRDFICNPLYLSLLSHTTNRSGRCHDFKLFFKNEKIINIVEILETYLEEPLHWEMKADLFLHMECLEGMLSLISQFNDNKKFLLECSEKIDIIKENKTIYRKELEWKFYNHIKKELAQTLKKHDIKLAVSIYEDVLKIHSKKVDFKNKLKENKQYFNQALFYLLDDELGKNNLSEQDRKYFELRRFHCFFKIKDPSFIEKNKTKVVSSAFDEQAISRFIENKSGETPEYSLKK